MSSESVNRIIGVGDIHGCYELLINLVERSIKFDPEKDRLVFLGDYLDRGANSKEVVDYVTSLKRQCPGQIVLLKGNHEDLALKALFSPGNEGAGSNQARMLWYLNGGQATVNSYGGSERAREALIPFVRSLDLYHETGTHIFVHAGIPYGKSPATASADELLWDRSFSYNGRKTLIVGHTPKSEIERLRNIICLDTGAFLTGKLTAYDVLNEKAYQAKTA
jgi:serine/threonine protein phosphatase 1